MTPEELKKFAEEIIPLLDRYADKLSEATYSHWNALLTFNGILVGAFSVLAALDRINKLIALILLGLSVCSSILLIINFIGIGKMYNEILKKLTDRILPVLGKGPNEYSGRKKESAWRYRFTFIAQCFLILEALILFVLIYCLK